MNILVTGGNGQLGTALRLVSRNSRDRYIFSDIAGAEGRETLTLDITDREAVDRLVGEMDIDAIINCAAYTDVDRAEDNIELARRLNAEAPAILAAAMARRNGFLVHISTDYVFGGADRRTPYREDAVGEPTGVYGLTKLEGEKAIEASGCRHIIIRTAWLYSEYGRNFCLTMLRLTATKAEVRVVDDQFGTPTYAGDLAAAIYRILENRLADSTSAERADGAIYHFSNEGSCNWFEFASRICSRARELDPSRPECRVLPCSSEEFPSKVRRPSYSVLDKTLIKKSFGLEIPKWEDSLDLCLENILLDNDTKILHL